MNFKALSKNSVRWLGFVGLVSVVSGCASMGDGSNYSCSGMPGEEDEVGCMSVREVYDETDQANYQGQNLTVDDDSESDEGESVAYQPRQGAGNNLAESAPMTNSGLPESRGIDPLNVPDNYVAPNMPDRPVPIRTPSQVMRIWISAWESEAGDLVTPGYLYTEIEPRRWVLGDKAESNASRSFAPLNAR